MKHMNTQKFEQFLKAHGWDNKPIYFLAGDCSNRKYYRLGVKNKGSVVLMDAPPPEERLGDFIEMASLLKGLGLSVPDILHADLEKGFALIEDFGDRTYSRLLAQGDDEKYYTIATDTLIYLHQTFDLKKYSGLTLFSFDIFVRELDVMLEWYYPKAYGAPLSAKNKESFLGIWKTLLKPLLMPETLVLRDYMVDNLVYLEDRPGIKSCGLLDFQDALLGRRAYDLVSLLEDARYDVSHEIQMKMKARYLDAFPQLDRPSFLEEYAILGAQRSIKILGIFMRMYVRHKQEKYLAHIPRVWRWIEQDLTHPSLSQLKDWMERHMPNVEGR